MMQTLQYEQPEITFPPILQSENQKTQDDVGDRPSDKLGLSKEFRSSGIYRGICEMNPLQTLICIRRGENVNIVCSNTGTTLLHVIMIEANPVNETKYVPFVYQLSNANVSLDRKNNSGLNPLQLAIRLHLLELMISIIKCGATCNPEADLDLITFCSGPLEYDFRSCYQRFSPGYWLPVEQNKAFKVNVLIKSWSRINIQINGKTLIEFAKQREAQEKIIKMLLDNEVSIEFAHATIAGDDERMQHLLQHYTVDMNTKDYSHRENYFQPFCPLTLVGAAIKYGHKHILHLLTKSGAEALENKPLQHIDQNRLIDPMVLNSSAICSII